MKRKDSKERARDLERAKMEIEKERKRDREGGRGSEEC